MRESGAQIACRWGWGGDFCIYTKSRHVSVETLMTGYEKMESYITENVAPEKIIMKER